MMFRKCDKKSPATRDLAWSGRRVTLEGGLTARLFPDARVTKA